MREKLNQLTTAELTQLYYANYTYDNRLPALFALIDDDKLRTYIITSFTLDFKPVEISELLYELNGQLF